MTRAEWAVLLAVMCRRMWTHTAEFGWPTVNLWDVRSDGSWLSLSVPEREAE